MAQHDTLKELSEAEAPYRVAEIYAQLRRLTGVPVVALIFRHLATHDGLLDQIWAALRPLLTTGVLQDAAVRVVNENIPPDLIPPIDANVRCAIGVHGVRLPPVLNAIDAYNRANAINLLITLCLLRRLELPDSTVVPVPARAWSPPSPIAGPLSRMMSPAEMPGHIRRMVNDFGFGDRTGLDPVVPSLLRHLCDEPSLLAVLHVVLAPKFKDGTLTNAMARLTAAMALEAERLAPQIGLLPRLTATPYARLVVEEFTGSWIPQMTVIGFALRRSLRDT
jgi:hypothetical protein